MSVDKCAKNNSKEYSLNLNGKILIKKKNYFDSILVFKNFLSNYLELISKWKTLEPNVLIKKQKFALTLNVSSEVQTIKNLLNSMSIICKDKKFKSIDSLRLKIEELEVLKNFFAYKLAST